MKILFRMKRIVFYILIVLCFIVSSCDNNNKTEVQYKTHMSHNKAYEVEIPVDYTETSSIGDLMSFVQENTHTFVSIQSLKADESLMNFATKNNQANNNNFVYTLIEQTDTSCFYKVPLLHFASSGIWRGL